MAPLKCLIVSLCCFACVIGSPIAPPPRNTIFLDEMLEGGIFEDVDIFSKQSSLRNDDDNPYRLVNTTRPYHYNVLWAINMAELRLTGEVEITLHATQDNVNEIVIHSSDQNILSYQLLLGTTIIPVTLSANTTYEFLYFQLNTGSLQYNPITPVYYTLIIEFDGVLRDDMYGIYRSWFRNNYNDTPSYMASTQFQATSSRQAFPCYDEPSFKATFDITIRHPIQYTTWSLTRLAQSVVHNATYVDDIYNRTPEMSTYLLALIVAEYDTLRNNGTTLTYEVIARPSAIASGQAEYSYDVGQQLVDAMSNHTGIDFYSVHDTIKMTQAAIPDFSAGAMENWGLLTYREAYLMYDPNHTNSWNKQVIAYILSHEIAHMWYGNLVTCDWWDVLWLNEGYARYYQYFLTSWVEDYMGFETRFITEQVHTSLLADSANNPHPLTNPGLGSNSDVSAMFSTISYNKGAAIIRMTEHLMGNAAHVRGHQKYLNDNRFRAALPIDLFEALNEVGTEEGSFSQYGSDFSFIDYYKSWTEQGGHPVLNVNVNHETGEMTIVQRRFNINTGYSTLNTNYIIPISFATASNPDFNNTKPSHIISASLSIINRGTTGDEWVVFNKQQTGFYRVNYDDYTWDLIIMALRGANRTLIHSYNRAQIVDDAFQFARSGLISYTRCFNIISFLQNETEYAPWLAAITGFNWIRNRLVGSPYLTQVNQLFITWSSNIINQLGYAPSANEDFMTSYLRYQLAPVLCNMGVANCREAASAQFRQLMDNGIEVPVDSRSWVYCNALRDGSIADFNFLWQRYLQHEVYTEKLLLLQTLGCSPLEAAVDTYMTAIVEDNYIIRPQDYTTALNNVVAGNEANTQTVFRYVQNNLDRFANSIYLDISRPLNNVVARLRTESEVNEFILWANQNQPTLGASFNTLVSNAQATLQSFSWATEVATDLDTYLTGGDSTLEVTTSTTSAPVVTTTQVQPEIIEPVTPTLPDPNSAATSLISLLTIVVAVIANMFVR